VCTDIGAYPNIGVYPDKWGGYSSTSGYSRWGGCSSLRFGGGHVSRGLYLGRGLRHALAQGRSSRRWALPKRGGTPSCDLLDSTTHSAVISLGINLGFEVFIFVFVFNSKIPDPQTTGPGLKFVDCVFLLFSFILQHFSGFFPVSHGILELGCMLLPPRTIGSRILGVWDWGFWDFGDLGSGFWTFRFWVGFWGLDFDILD
jgi:hypothetical protein